GRRGFGAPGVADLPSRRARIARGAGSNKGNPTRSRRSWFTKGLFGAIRPGGRTTRDSRSWIPGEPSIEPTTQLQANQRVGRKPAHAKHWHVSCDDRGLSASADARQDDT